MQLFLAFVSVTSMLVSGYITRREDGPECPRFDYEYKVIERLVHLENRCEQLSRRQEELENLNHELEKVIEKQTQEIDVLSDKADGPPVVVAVAKLRKQVLQKGQTVIFEEPVTNIGKAYNPTTGMFEAPFNGTYMFSVKLCTKSGTWLNFRIMKNNDVIEEAFAGNEEWYTCGAGTSVTYVEAGERVWVTVLNKGGSGDVDRVHGIPSFTGSLLHVGKHYD